MMNLSSWLLPLFIGGFFISCLSPFLVTRLRSNARIIILIVPIAFTVFSSFGVAWLSEGKDGLIHIPWITFLNFGLSFSLDGLGLLFSLLISIFGVLIFFYASEYLKDHRDLGKFYFYILLFMMSMLGLVLSDHLLLLFIFWELTTFSSFLLIGFEHDKESARASAWQAILITTMGGLAMMAGLILLGSVCGTFRISEILQMGEVVKNSEYYSYILVLILMGAFTKSAQFPFHFWLPGAMAAPTPVSAYLHSATMVKAGIYLLARLSPVLAGTDLWIGIVSPVGAITMVIGGILAFKQDDLKLLLAYMTVMALGTLTLLLGLGTTEAIKASVVFLLVHSFYKGSLFLVTGSIDHGASTRKISELGGMLRVMPWTAAAAFIALLSMGGLPPVIGFIGKEMIYKATLIKSDIFSLTILIFSVLSMGIGTALSGVFFIKVFLGSRRSLSASAHENGPALWGPPLLLGVAGLAMGVFPGWMEFSLVTSAVSAIKGENVTTALFAGVKLDRALLMSVISTILGLSLYFMAGRIKAFIINLSKALTKISSEAIYARSLSGVLRFAGWQTKVLQQGYHTKYLMVVFLVVVIALGTSLYLDGSQMWRPYLLPELDLYEWIVSALISVAAIASLLSHTLIGAVLLLGVVGYGVAILFVIYGAPDLALTQILIETLTIIFIALIGIKFPAAFTGKDLHRHTIAKGVVAVAVGSIMTMILWNVMSHPFDPYLSQYFAEYSYSIGKGRNIVNVILVDYRALDTLGEITVLAVGAIGFYSLIKMARRSREIK